MIITTIKPKIEGVKAKVIKVIGIRKAMPTDRISFSIVH
jgi:hypothetical protein